MLHLNAVTVAGCFLLLMTLCYLANEALRFVGTRIIPTTVSVNWDVAAVVAYNLPIVIVMASGLLLILPAGLLLVALLALLVFMVVFVQFMRFRRGWVPGATFRGGLGGTMRSWRKHPVSIALAVASFAYFVWVGSVMQWPPVGDVTFLHGPLTTYLVYGGYGGAVAHMGYYYPMGFHVIPAAIVGPLGLYPAEAVFVYGAFIAALIPPMMYTLSRQLGASSLTAVIAFFAAFVVHPSDNLEQWILGPFFNGPYSNLLGLLLMIVVMSVLVGRVTNDISLRSLRVYGESVLLLAVVLFLVYPTFAALVVVHFLALAASELVLHRKSIPRLRRVPGWRAVVMIAAVTVAVALLVVGLALQVPYLSLIWRLYAAPPPDYLAYQVPLAFFINNPTGFLVLLGLPIAAYHLWTRRHLGISSFYFITFGLVILSIDPFFYSLIWPILPSRTLMVLGIVAWPLFLSEVVPFMVWVGRRIQRWRRAPRSSHWPARHGLAASTVVVFVLLLAILANTNPTVDAFNAPTHYGWFSASPTFVNDTNGIEWLAAHARPDELVLSDGSFISRYALSVGLVKLSDMIPWEYNRSLYVPLNLIWEYPYNETYVMQTLKTYNVRFILSTSEWGMFDLLGSGSYVIKPYPPSLYASVFDGYSFLTVGFAAGATRVYVVNQTAL